MCVRIIPLSEHDSFYCLDDVELWEVSFNLLVSEDKSKLPEIAALPREITGDDQVKSGADSPVTTDVTVTSSSSNSFQMDYPTAYPRNTSVEMISWGPVPVVMARLLDEIVEIRQNPSGEGTGCVLWASSVILSRFILSENFTGRGFSECQISAGKINSEHFRRPRIAVELGSSKY